MPSSRPQRDRIIAGAAAVALLAACIVYMAVSFRWRDALGILAHADLAIFLGGGTAAILVYWVLRALRWRALLAPQPLRGGFLELYLCSSVALSLSVLTPLQSGEALKVELMRRHAGLDRMPGYGAFLIERTADLYAIAAIGVLALAWRGWPQAVALGAVLALVPVVGFALLHRLRLPGAAGRVLEHVQQAVASPGALGRVIVATFLGWFAVALGWDASLAAVGVDVDAAQALSLLAAITLATLVSLIPGGLGIAEVGSAGMLERFGFDAAHAQAGALALRAFSILVMALGAAHLAALKLRDPSLRAAKEIGDHPLP